MKPTNSSKLTLFFLLAAASSTGASPFRIGEPAPRLRLPSVSGGSPLSLADFHGEKVMLHVWASW